MYKFDKPVMVTKSFLPPIQDYIKEIQRIWEVNWLTNQGPVHNDLKVKLKKYLGVQNITLFVNGHLALDIAIKSLGLKGEAITTPFTFASTTHAITANGLKPVFCDIKKEDYTIDENKIEALITENTSAIIPVHVFGNPCNVEKIQMIASKYNLKVIYDAAHVFGVELQNKPIGLFGDVSMFSFHATKVFNTIEGGALVYNDPSYEKGFDLHKNFGITGPETVEAVGLNAKMNEFQAAMGIVNLVYVNEEIEKRKQVAYKYRKCLSDICGLELKEDIYGVKHNYAYFPILINEEIFGMDRNKLHNFLIEYNVYTRKYFYPLVNEFQCYKDIQNVNTTPIAKYVGDRILTLPMYGSLSLVDVENICEIIRYFKKE